MTHKPVLLAAFFCLAAAQAASASDVAVGVVGGTTGASLEAKVALSPHVRVRGAYNYLDLSVDVEGENADYEGDLSLSNFAAFADVAPFGGGFVLSGGAYVGPKEIDLLATPTNLVTIGDQTFTTGEAGVITGQAEFAGFAPYVGIGYDGFATSKGAWSVNARAGVMFTGSADVTLASEGGEFSTDPRLLEQLRIEEAAIEDDAEDYKYYPVLTLGVSRRF